MDVTEDIKVEIIEVLYDFEKIASAIEKNELPVKFANIIRTGKAWINKSEVNSKILYNYY